MNRFLKITAFILLFICQNIFAQSWFLQETGAPGSIRAIKFITPTTGFCAGPAGKIYKTTNSGNVWTEIAVNFTGEIYCMSFLSSGTGYMAGESGKIIKTTNSGLNWTEINANLATVVAMVFTDAFTGYISCLVIGGSEIYRTTNGGLNWTYQLGLTETIYNIRNYTSTLFACGRNGTVIKSTNFGSNWLFNSISTNNTLFAICPVSATSVITGGENLIYRTTNNGVNWHLSTPTPQTDFTDIFMVNQTTGFAAGNMGHIFKTYDGGVNWYQLNYYENYNFESIFFINETTGYFTRNDGKIIKTTNGGGSPIGIQPIGSEIPERFSLEQNYPNPFNPVTNIKFSVPKEGLVVLKVYDISGREVAELINQNLSAGTFNYYFDASHLSSGVYFYRIDAEGFTDVKKMIFVK